ncbi:TPA: Dot/Icm T4SS effector Lem24, partial [Legionella pneumophila]|nr:Dot/Icm T4SS effector Lem24 [Legionella pneumophila]
MWIFKDITDRYCKKILDSYQLQADEKTYKGKEAELLIQRNELARCLIKTISLMEVKTQEDYANYFKRVSDEINSALQAAKNAVKEYNEEKNTDFTTDLYESFFTYSL